MVNPHPAGERPELLADLLHRVRLVARHAHLASRAEPGAVTVTNIEGLVLQFVANKPGARTSDMADRLGLRLGNASSAVSGLVDKGLLRRENDPADRRVSTVWLTEAAHANIARVHARWARELDDLDVSIDELRNAVEVLHKVDALLDSGAVERAAEAGPSPV